MFGLKQALSSWNYRFDVIIMVYDLIQNENDSCVYKKVSGSALTKNVPYKIMIIHISFLGNEILIINNR